jgi:hypothetical protein
LIAHLVWMTRGDGFYGVGGEGEGGDHMHLFPLSSRVKLDGRRDLDRSDGLRDPFGKLRAGSSPRQTLFRMTRGSGE